MKPYTGYKAQMNSGGRDILPAGGYVAKIIEAKSEETNSGERLTIAFDIVEGAGGDKNKDIVGFFKRDFDNCTQDGKKWRGVFRINWPSDSVPENEQWKIRQANDAIGAIEASNQGYNFEATQFNETTLKGKNVGVLFRNKEWEMNGNTGWTTECCKLTDAQKIRDNNFKTPKDKALNKDSVGSDFTRAANGAVNVSAGGFGDMTDVSSDLPF